MEESMSEQEISWKTKAKRVILGLVVFLLFVWSFSVANKAKSIAEENQKRLTKPSYEMSFLLGGPERFSDEFDSIDNAEAEKIKTDQFMWSTFIIKNTSSGNASDLEINLNKTATVEKILVNASGWDNEISIEEGENPTNSIISVEDITPQEPMYIFLGLNREEIPDNLSDWNNDYKELITSVIIDADDSSAHYYGQGYDRSM